MAIELGENHDLIIATVLKMKVNILEEQLADQIKENAGLLAKVDAMMVQQQVNFRFYKKNFDKI